MINLVQLKYFCRVYELLSYSKASDELYLTRQALRKSISALEIEIHGELFEKLDTGLKPTHLAKFLYPEAKKLLSSEEKLLRNLHEYSLHQKQILRLGAAFSALETFYPTLPIDFRESNPEIDLSINTMPDNRLEELVEKDELDGAFVIGSPENQKLMHSILLESQPLFFVMKPGMTENDGQIGLEEAAMIPLLLVDDGFKAYHQMMERFSRKQLKPNIRYTSSDFSLLVILCAKGEGAVPVPESRLQTVLTADLIARQIAPEDDPRWEIYFIRKKQSQMSYALQTFEDMLMRKRKPAHE